MNLDRMDEEKSQISENRHGKGANDQEKKDRQKTSYTFTTQGLFSSCSRRREKNCKNQNSSFEGDMDGGGVDDDEV